MNSNYTDVTIVLDRSGSMDIIKEATIGGINKFIDDQKALINKKVTLSLIQFDAPFTSYSYGSQAETQDPWYKYSYTSGDVKFISPLNDSTYQPRGGTALIDAMAKAIIETGDRLSKLSESERPANVVFAVMTDGQENQSKEYTRTKVMEMVKHQTDKYNWIFTFLGANQNAILEAATYGFTGGNTITYASNFVGTRAAMDSFSTSIHNIAVSGCANIGGAFYNVSDRTAQTSAGVDASLNITTN